MHIVVVVLVQECNLHLQSRSGQRITRITSICKLNIWIGRCKLHAVWDFLETNTSLACKIEGPPGTGKSSIVWAWACMKAYEKKVPKIVWLHFNQCYDGELVVLKGGGRK